MGATPAKKKQWILFLSHDSRDKPFVDWLHQKLLSSTLKTWYDKYEILVGESIPGGIEKGLKGSEFLLVVISEYSVKSNWVKAELEPKILEQIEGGQVTVLPLALGDTNPEDLSIFLRGKKWLRFPLTDWDKDSDEQLQELLRSIEEHLKRRNGLKKR